MLIPVAEGLFRWGTPDPEMDQMMYGYLLVREGRCILIDPPFVHGLLDSVSALGDLEAAIITTLDHTRAIRYLKKLAEVDIYIPDQMKSMTIDPEEYIACRQIIDYNTYRKERVLGLKPIRITVDGEDAKGEPYMDEYALLTENGELLTGDISVGTGDGKILVAPEWFPIPDVAHPPAHSEFKRVVISSKANSMLASHGHNIIGSLQEAASKL